MDALLAFGEEPRGLLYGVILLSFTFHNQAKIPLIGKWLAGTNFFLGK